jgi:hypothetical protein
MSIILSFDCGNAWTQCSHFYLRHERRPWVYEPLLPFVRPDQRRCLLCVICKADIIRRHKCWWSTISSISLKRTTTFSFNNMQTLHHYYATRIYISIKLLNLGFLKNRLIVSFKNVFGKIAYAWIHISHFWNNIFGALR